MVTGYNYIFHISRLYYNTFILKFCRMDIVLFQTQFIMIYFKIIFEFKGISRHFAHFSNDNFHRRGPVLPGQSQMWSFLVAFFVIFSRLLTD